MSRQTNGPCGNAHGRPGLTSLIARLTLIARLAFLLSHLIHYLLILATSQGCRLTLLDCRRLNVRNMHRQQCSSQRGKQKDAEQAPQRTTYNGDSQYLIHRVSFFPPQGYG